MEHILAEGFDSLFNWDKLGAVGILAAIVIGLIKGWIVPGSYYSDLKVVNEKLLKENEELRRGNQTAVRIAEKLVDPNG